jgi:TatD DNase family protein
LDFPEFEKDRQDVVERAKKENVEHIINIGTSLSASLKSVELSLNSDSIFASAGIHPSEIENAGIDEIDKLNEIAKNKKVVAIGETGLDFNYSRNSEEKQKEFFIYQIEIAERLGLPLIIHQREAEKEIKEILTGRKLPGKVVFHCFCGDEGLLDWCMKNGFYVSFTGIVTFPKAQDAQKVVKSAPLDRIMIETDAPFLSPVPLRGKRNEPSYLRFILEKTAQIKQMDIKAAEDIIFQNSIRFFNL